MKRYVWLIILIGCFASGADAQSGALATGRQFLSATLMALTSSTKQGGEGPAGSTTLSQTEYVYAWTHFGLGLFFLYDMQGSAEKDSMMGPKLEAYLDPFYLQLGYISSAKRAYTDRTIAEQTGTGTLLGLGVRFKLGASASGATGGWFFQASYNYRTLVIQKQDGIELDEKIQQVDGYPLVGLGYQF